MTNSRLLQKIRLHRTKLMLLSLTCLTVLLLTSCGTTRQLLGVSSPPAPPVVDDFCQTEVKYNLEPGDYVHDSLARAMLAHNLKGERKCGWPKGNGKAAH